MDASQLLLAAGVALAGVVVGARVQRTARFIYPLDFMTLAIAAFILADLALGATGIEATWYAAFILGYIVGYLIVGRTSYMMLWTTDLANKELRMVPLVTWTEDGRQYLQKQSNVALFRRLVLRVRHDIVSNVPLEDDWYSVIKYPAFPLFRRCVVVAEAVDTWWEPQHLFWKFSAKHYVTSIQIAYAGTVSKLQLAQDEDSLKEMQDQNNRLIREIRNLRNQQGPALMEMELRMEQARLAAKPVNRMFEMLCRRPQPPKDGDEKKGTPEETAKIRKEVDDATADDEGGAEAQS
ncbi:hypothetical protein O8W32_06565 [Methanomassiliicoccales archaeon LGM-DZ1]|nr:hypothetical protein O8W32_06565 [Methanomassiliicoccales archaeon LGM-DZ1]